MTSEKEERGGVPRRRFLQFLGAGAAGTVLALEHGCTFLRPVDDGNPLSRHVPRDWEKIYHDQYRYDSSFDWVCSPNDTHACRIRAFVRNGIVVRSGATYDYQNYADLYGNHASINWNPRQCAKGYTFHRVLYGPYRLRHPIVRKGWKAWAEAGFPELTADNKDKYYFSRRGDDEFIQMSWEDAFSSIARASSFMQAPGHAHDLGIELNANVYFQSKDGARNDDPNKKGGFFTKLEYGVLFPMAGLGYTPNEVSKLSQAGLSTSTNTAQTLRWYLGVFF